MVSNSIIVGLESVLSAGVNGLSLDSLLLFKMVQNFSVSLKHLQENNSEIKYIQSIDGNHMLIPDLVHLLYWWYEFFWLKVVKCSSLLQIIYPKVRAIFWPPFYTYKIAFDL